MLFLNCWYWVWQELQQSTAWPRESWGTSALHRWSCFGETLLFCCIYAISWMEAQAPTCQRHRSSGRAQTGRTWQDRAVGSSSHHLLHPGALAQAAPGKSIGGQQTLCSHGTTFPKWSSSTLGPCAAGEPHTHSTLWKVSVGSTSSGEGRWVCKVSLNWTWVASSAQQPSQGGQRVPEPISRAGRALEKQTAHS